MDAEKESVQLAIEIENKELKLCSMEAEIAKLEQNIEELVFTCKKIDNNMSDLLSYQNRKATSYDSLLKECTNLKCVSAFTGVMSDYVTGNNAKDVVLSLQNVQDTVLMKLSQMRIQLEELYEQREQLNLLISDLQYAQRIAQIEEAN